MSWQRLSSWLPWMEMGDRAGMLYFHTAGRKLDKWDDLSATMKAEIDSNYPEYRNPPPLDDQRPNETSWTYFKKHRWAPGSPGMSSPSLRELLVCNPRTGEPDYCIPATGAAEMQYGPLVCEQTSWPGLLRVLSIGPQSSRRGLRLLAEPGPVLDALVTDTGRHLLALREIHALGGMVSGNVALATTALVEPAERPSLTPGIHAQTRLNLCAHRCHQSMELPFSDIDAGYDSCLARGLRERPSKR